MRALGMGFMWNGSYIALNEMGPSKGPFVLKPTLLGQPRLNSRGAVLSFPFLQRLVVAAFGFDDFAGVRVLVDLHLAWLPSTGLRLSGWSTTARSRIKQVDHVRQTVSVLSSKARSCNRPFNFKIFTAVTSPPRTTRPCHGACYERLAPEKFARSPVIASRRARLCPKKR